MPSINKLIERMRYYCGTASVGYDQSSRWDVRDGGETDCSALVIACLREAGFAVGAATYTGNMSEELTAHGWRRLQPDGAPQPGDILLNDSKHVAVYLGGGQLAQASKDENGNTSGGQAGDQTGMETNITNYYNFPWNCYLRYTGENEDTVTAQVLFDTRDQDGRNLFDEAIQTRAELTDRAKQAIYEAKGLDGRNVLDGVIQARHEIAELKTLITAQGATIETLARAAGADPSTIARIVQQAVKDKLDQLHITVEEVKP